MNKHPFLLICSLIFLLALTACEAANDEQGIPPMPPTLVVNVDPLIGSGTGDTDTDAPTAVPVDPAATTTSEAETEAEPTPTLIPSPTASPTAVTMPVTDPPITAVGIGQLPPISRDLLFVNDGALRRWNHLSGQIDTLVAGPDPAQRTYSDPNDPRQYYGFPGDVTHYAVSQNGKRAIVVRIVRSDIVPVLIPEQSEEPRDFVRQVQELIYVDLVSGERWTVAPQIYNVLGVALSPNGERVTVSATAVGQTPPEPTRYDGYAEWESNIFVQEMQGGNGRDIRQIHTCDNFCSDPVWHIENNLAVWGDYSGLWLYNTAATSPEILLPSPQVDPVNAPDLREVYGPIDWANNGRYLRIWRSVIEGGSQAILDIPTGTLIDIPDSFVYVAAFPIEISWMPDDRLLVAYNGNEQQPAPSISLWRVLLDEGRVAREELLALSNQPVGVQGSAYLDDGRFAYTLMGDGTQSASGTYLLTSLSQPPERVNAVPDGLTGGEMSWIGSGLHVLWANDGSGAISWSYTDIGEVFYAPVNGDALYQVTPALGRGAKDFHWITP